MDPNSMLARMLVCASAPGARPVISFARLISLTAIPPLFMMLPARMKNGMASRLNTEIPEKILWHPVSTATSRFIIGKIAHTDETPSATAIGTPAISMISKRTRIISPDTKAIFIIFLPPCSPDSHILCTGQSDSARRIRQSGFRRPELPHRPVPSLHQEMPFSVS